MNEPMLQFFEYKHLPERLQSVSQPFGEMAQRLVETLPRNPDRTTALRKLLEAKDCAVRALLWKELPAPRFEAHAGSPTADQVPDPKPTAPA